MSKSAMRRLCAQGQCQREELFAELANLKANFGRVASHYALLHGYLLGRLEACESSLGLAKSFDDKDQIIREERAVFELKEAIRCLPKLREDVSFAEAIDSLMEPKDG